MALINPTTPKQYKDGKVLFESNLDAWRLAVDQDLAVNNLNLTQIGKDCFGASYIYNNNGSQSVSKSLQQQINDLASGATVISGTSATTFSINTLGNKAVLSTIGLTGSHTYTFPDFSGTFVLNPTLVNVKFESGAAIQIYSDAGTTLKFQIDSSGNITSNGGFVTDLKVNSGNIILNNGNLFNVYSDVATTLKFKINGATGDFGASGKYFIGDPTLAGGEYLYKSAANVVNLFVGTSHMMQWNNASSLTTVETGSFSILSGNKIFLDGGGDTYFQEVAANSLNIVAGGSAFNVNATQVTLDTTQDLLIRSGKKCFLDGGTNDYLINSADGQNDIFCAGTLGLRITNSLIQIPDGNKIVLDGNTGNNTITVDNTYFGFDALLFKSLNDSMLLSSFTWAFPGASPLGAINFGTSGNTYQIKAEAPLGNKHIKVTVDNTAQHFFYSDGFSCDGGTNKFVIQEATAAGDAASNGYVSMVLNGATVKLMTRA